MIKRSLLVLLLSVLTAVALPNTKIFAERIAHSLAVVFLPSHQSNDSSIETFWAKFKAAVIAGDKSGVAAMSQFPIEMPYGVASVKNRSQLIRRYREVFNVQANAQKCFADSKPVIDASNRNRFEVGCKDSAGNEVVVYGFVRTRAGWKFKSLDNINE
jgi:hypothetical protein